MADFHDLARHAVRAEDVAFDDVSLLRFGEVRDALGQYGISVVDIAIFSDEPEEALGQVSRWFIIDRYSVYRRSNTCRRWCLPLPSSPYTYSVHVFLKERVHSPRIEPLCLYCTEYGPS